MTDFHFTRSLFPWHVQTHVANHQKKGLNDWIASVYEWRYKLKIWEGGTFTVPTSLFFLTPPFFLSSLTSHSSCPTRIKCSNPHWTGSATCVELKASRRARSRVTSCTRQLPEKGSGFLWFFVQLVIDVQQKARIVNPSLSPPHPQPS